MNMVNPSINREAQEKMIERMRSRRKKYTAVVHGRTYVVYPNVFSPSCVLDSAWYATRLPNQEGKRMLEIGSGTGLIAVTAALQGAVHVTAVDINPYAVRNTIENAKRHGVANLVSAYRSDIFRSIRKGQTFDTIIWNVPWGDFGRGEKLNLLQRAFYDPGYKLLRRFIRGARKFLRPKGKLLIGFSTSVGKFDVLQKLLKESGVSYRIAAKGRFAKGHPAGAIKIEIFEGRLK